MRYRTCTIIAAAIPLLPMTSPAPASGIQEGPAAETVQEESLRGVATEEAPIRDPEATRVLARSLEAMGGREARDRLVSSRSLAMLRMGETNTKFELLTRGKEQFLVRHTITGLGPMVIGYDGQVGWRSDPPDDAVSPITAREAAEFLRTFDFQALLRELDRRFDSARIQPAQSIESVECDVVLLEEDDERLKVFFDRETGLIKAFEVVADSDRRRRRVVIEAWSDQLSPMRWARRLRIEQPRTDMIADYSSVTFDDVAEATFEPPPGIQAPQRESGT